MWELLGSGNVEYILLPEHIDDVAQRLEHDVRRRLSLVHHPQELHDLDEAFVVALLHLRIEIET